MHRDTQTIDWDGAAATIQRALVRDLDPITHRPIRVKFLLNRGEKLHSFDAHSLLMYIRYSGDLTDPLCRSPYQRHELMRLQRLTGETIPPDTLNTRVTETDHEMLLDVLVDDVVREEGEEGGGGSIAMVAMVNVRSILRTGRERDLVVSRLRQSGVSLPALAPLIVLMFEDESNPVG